MMQLLFDRNILMKRAECILCHLSINHLYTHAPGIATKKNHLYAAVRRIEMKTGRKTNKNHLYTPAPGIAMKKIISMRQSAA